MEVEILRGKEGRKVTMVGFWVNAGLVAIKLIAGILGRSGAMMADGIHSLSDFMTDLVVILGFRFTEKPEDECHNYGHGKYETLATVIISIFLFVVGIEIFKVGAKNILKFFNGEILPKPGAIALIAAAVSIISKEILFRYTFKVGNRIKSSAVVANAWHHRSDAMSSVGTFLGIGGAVALGQKWAVLDPIASVIVSVFIFKVAVQILMPAINELMEAALTEEEQSKIRDIIDEEPGVISHHQLRTRRLGTRAVIEVHVQVHYDLTVIEGHAIATHIETKIKDLLGYDSIITTHIEPRNY